MKPAKPIIIALTLALFGLVGLAEARDRDGKARGHRDAPLVKQGVDRRRGKQRAVARGGKAHHKRDRDIDRADNRSRRFEKRFDRRQDRQQRKIRRSLRKGELTRGEARLLRKQQRRIGRLADRFAEDGRFSKAERKRLKRAQERASRRISRARHNNYYRDDTHHRYGRRYRHQDLYWRYLNY